MSIIQETITGPVAYEKAIYETDEKRTMDVHYIGDDHQKETSCDDPHAMTTLSLLTSTFSQPHPPVDVFIEVGLGYVGTKRTNYLNELISEFQALHCLAPKKTIECEQSFPNVRFHCVDFRHTLYLEYDQVIDHWWTKENGRHSTTPLDDMLSFLMNTASQLHLSKSTKTISYVSTFSYERELLRLTWIYDLIEARGKRYNQHPPIIFSPTLSEFTADLYYLICMSPSAHAIPSSLPSVLHRFYPPYLERQPYYIYRLAHEYRSIPEVQHDAIVQRRVDIALKDRIDAIRHSSTPKQIQLDTYRSPKQTVEHANVCLSWLMDIYTCFRILKPYISHVVIMLGVDHIQQMNQFMHDIGIKVHTSIRFDNPDHKYKHGAQCISIPTKHRSLGFDHDLFPMIKPNRPRYKGTRRKSRRTRRKSRRTRRKSKRTRRKSKRTRRGRSKR